MASLHLPSVMEMRPFSEHFSIALVGGSVLLFVAAVFSLYFSKSKTVLDLKNKFEYWVKFAYSCFLKPHDKHGDGTQQSALESFYKAQADIYDVTRSRLLRGREEMLALVAAQLKCQGAVSQLAHEKPIWVDIGGGTGWNIEEMDKSVPVQDYFSAVYLVDYSPSLCAVARKRFARLGWTNVHVVCQDARLFTLPFGAKADLVTMSYSLSMLPNFHVFIDAASSLLDDQGIIGVVDFYVQSSVDVIGRNYLGGNIQRHVNWLGRTFWRAWFDLDRVGLEGARRDYLEYRFGTLKTVDERNYILGNLLGLSIPYYIFLGRQIGATFMSGDLETVDAACTESPYLSPKKHRLDMINANSVVERRSKAYECAIINLSARLPLPSTFYQNFHHRIYYDESLEKHTQFNNEFIYAFTWEDSRVDQRLLKINSDDVILALTSAGDNLLDYLASQNPRRIHAVDLNPSQNHLLELKVAAYQALNYADFWKMFGEGRFPEIKDVLLSKLSPYLSSQALQFWLNHTHLFTSDCGLYEYGGSGYAIKIIRQLLWLTGLSGSVDAMCNAKTLAEQREIWPRIRRVLMNKIVHYSVVGSSFLWKAAGVPPSQAAMITKDHVEGEAAVGSKGWFGVEGEAMWQFIFNTLDPVARDTLLSEDNYYYGLALQGKYTRRCHPNYLSAKAHARLSRPGAFDGLRIHTDEINEVIARLQPGALTIVIIMDSMDWFDPVGAEAGVQIRALNDSLKVGGRVFLRSAGLKPWYIPQFEALGFSAKRVGARFPGTCIDRVNMYASTWILTKTHGVSDASPETPMLEKLEI